jgi:4-carboxymuconolactone decarboxylase
MTGPMRESTTGPRLAPIPAEQWTEEQQAALRGAFPKSLVDSYVRGGPDAPPVPTVLATLIHHPVLAAPFLVFNNVLLRTPALTPRQRELMVLRVAWRTRSRYEWIQHARLRDRYDITLDDVEAIARGELLDSWNDLERALVGAADQLLDDSCISDATWARLAEDLDERQLVEIVFTVGTYTMLAMAFNSFEMEMEAGVDYSGIPLP